MKKILLALSFLVVTVAVMAVPAKRGQWKTLKLQDGTEVRAQLVGDEHGHFWCAADGKTYGETADGEFYQVVDAQKIVANAQVRRQQVNAQRAQRLASHRAQGRRAMTGQKKAIMLLVEFKDKQFNTGHDNALFNRIANEEGYSEGNFKGSMADYFKAQSRGAFELDFDVVGPLAVSERGSYYGTNDSQGNDNHPGQMVCEAVTLAMEQITDWTPYDWDGDGFVDQVYVVYAGKGEADGGASNTIWPHAYDLYSSQYYGDGTGPVTVGENLKVNSYACGPELNGNGHIGGIGTMCHEYSHCLGYPDFYDVDYSGGQGMGAWDLMDQGSYNGDGYLPAGYTGYERWVAGWLEPIELNAEDVSITDMKSLQDGGDFYIIYNKGNQNEYMMLENRQKDGWDGGLPEPGLLIIHCDYDESAWAANTPNDNPDHQRMVVVPADGKCQYYMYMGTKYFTDEGDPFPQGSVNAFNKGFKTSEKPAKKAAQFFNKNTNGTYWIDSSVENITQNSNGTISFDFFATYTPADPGDDTTLFYESFDDCDGKGGNDNMWSGSIANGEFLPDNEGWTAAKSFGANQCAKFGTASVAGSATTPAITLDGTTTVTFKAGAWNASADGTVLNLSVEGGTIEPASVDMKKGSFTDFSATISGSGEIKMTFASAKGRFFLDEVTVAKPNATAIQTVNVSRQQTTRVYTLDGRYAGSNPDQLPRGMYILNGKKIVK